MNGAEDFKNTDYTGVPGDDTDLSGMDVEAAKEYVMAFITSLKQLQRQMTTLGAELKTWLDRVAFAASRNRHDLSSAAEQRVNELKQKLAGLQTEEQDLGFKVKELLENFKKLKAGFTFSIDADRLLAELEMLVGEKDVVAEQFKEEETLAELERLKKQMNDDPG